MVLLSRFNRGGPWGLLMKAALEMEEDRPSTALALLEEAVARDPHAAHAHYGRGLALAALGHHGDAHEVLGEAVRLAPESPVFRYARARSSLVLQHWAEALTDLEEALKTEPTLGDAHYARGIALMESWRDHEAQWSFSHASDQLKGNPLPRCALAICLRLRGLHEQALSQWSSLVQEHPEWPDALYESAVCNYELGRVDVALETLCELETLDLDDWLAEQVRRLIDETRSP